MASISNPLASLDDTIFVPTSNLGSGTGPAILPSIPSLGTGTATTQPSNPSVSSLPSSPSSGGISSFFGARGVAIILGFLLIAGAMLLFAGDDIAGAIKIVSK